MAKLMGEFLQFCVPHTKVTKISIFMDIFIAKLMNRYIFHFTFPVYFLCLTI
jgi:hypothetical protein